VLKVAEDKSGSGSKPDILDARSSPRFKAEVDEPRKGLDEWW